jgi:uncharacterized protein
MAAVTLFQMDKTSRIPLSTRASTAMSKTTCHDMTCHTTSTMSCESCRSQNAFWKASKKYLQPGEVAETMITEVLRKNGCPPRLMSKVALIVEHVSFSSEIKRPQLVKAMVNAHPELGVVQDADRLDAIGAVGIARCFAFGGVKASGRGLHGCIEHFTEKLENLEGMMKTETGRGLAEERTRRLQEFRGWWDEENAGLS